MRITRDNVTILSEALEELRDGPLEAFIDSAEVWLDEDTDREEHADARQDMEAAMEELTGLLADCTAALEGRPR